MISTSTVSRDELCITGSLCRPKYAEWRLCLDDACVFGGEMITG